MSLHSLDWPIEGTQLSWSRKPFPRLPKATLSSPFVDVCHQELQMYIPQIAQFRVHGGDAIEIFREPGVQFDQIAQLLMATPYGVQVLQRGELPLHAAGLVRPDGVCLMLSADSGVGKSTTAAEMTRNGWRIHSDDVCRVTTTGGISLHPGFQHIKLLPDACAILGLGAHELPRSRGLKDKRLYSPPKDAKVRAPHVLCLLKREKCPSGSQVRRIRGFEAFLAITRYTFRSEFIEAMGCVESHFKAASALSDAIDIFELTISELASPAAVAQKIEECLSDDV